MPELPEVENVARSLSKHLTGRNLCAVMIRRADVVTGDCTDGSMLVGATVTAVDRLGKQLAIHGRAPNGARPCVCVHLGMSGSLWFLPPEPDQRPAVAPSPHDHVLWQVQGGGRLLFRDPRRFGGIWTFESAQALRDRRWARLGEDALRITPGALHRRLGQARRPIKAALLDQSVVAGLGNIYVDELLFSCRIRPIRLACTLRRDQVAGLVRRMRRLLVRSIEAGGSTFRSYSDANGTTGRFQRRLRVWGRAGQACVRCKAELRVTQVASRTTVHCPYCQV